VRERLQDEGGTEDLSARLKGLEKRLAAKQGEKDRYIRLYAQDHISEGELDTYLADLKDQIGSLRLPIEATEADLAQRRELRSPIQPSSGSTCSGSAPRRSRTTRPKPSSSAVQLVRLRVDGITLGRNEDGKTTVEVTYRFGPPEWALLEGYGELEQADDILVGVEQNSGPKEAEKIFRSARFPPACGKRKFGWA
jgi:hypothetical protein